MGLYYRIEEIEKGLRDRNRDRLRSKLQERRMQVFSLEDKAGVG